MKKCLAALLALACLLAAGCGKAAEEEEEPVAGDDWRTWGWVTDSVTAGTEDGGETALLLCVFEKNAALYYDEAVQTQFAVLEYPYELTGAQAAYESVSLRDFNGDGSDDVRLTFRGEDGAGTEWVWLWDGDAFVYDPALSASAS